MPLNLKNSILIPRRNPRALARGMNAILFFLLGRESQPLGRGAPLILLFILIHIITNYFILEKLPMPVCQDEAVHLMSSLNFYSIFTKATSLKDYIQLLYATKVPHQTVYPPLFQFSAAILNILFGTSRLVSVMTSIFYFLLMMVSVYLIGKKIDKEETGLFAAFILSMFPMIFGMSRIFLLEFCLTAVVCFSVYCLLCTESFTSRKYSLIFGLSLGLGMLVKFTFPIFIIGPLFYTLFKTFKSESLIKQKIKLKNIFLALIVGFSISYPWYAVNWSANIIKDISRFQVLSYITTRPSEIQLPWYTPDGLLFYFESVFFYQISPFFLFLLIFSIPPFIKSRTKHKPVFIIWLSFSFIAFTIIGNKASHYILPILPAIALILSIGVSAIPFIKLRYTLTTFAIIIGVIQFFGVTYFGYSKIEQIIDDIFIGSRIMKYSSLSLQNFVNFPNPFPYESYIKEKEILINNILPYIKRASSNLDKVVIGTIDSKFSDLRAKITYFCQKEGYKNVEVLDFWQVPDEFLNKSDRFDILFVLGNDKLWLDKEEIKNLLYKNRDLYQKQVLDNNFNKYEEMFKRFCREFRIIKTITHSGRKISLKTSNYIFILTKPHNDTFLSNMTQNLTLTPIFQEEELYNYDRIQSQRQRFSISKGPLSLIFHDGIAKIYFKEKEITEHKGLETSFKYQGLQYSSSEALYNVEKSNSDKLTITFKWPDIPFIQTWYLGFNEGNLDWRVNIVIDDKGVILEDIRADIYLKEHYKEWLSLFNRGKLLRVDFGNKNINLTDKFIGRIIGLKSLKDTAMPIVFFDSSQSELINKCLFNVMYTLTSGGINFSSMLTAIREDSLFIKNTQNLLSGQISFLAEENLNSYLQSQRQRFSISKGPLSLIFHDGIAKIYFKEKKITKNQGLDMCFKFNNNFYSLYQTSQWQINKTAPNEIMIRSVWKDAPITQIWYLRILDTNRISWQIDMEVNNKVKIEKGPFVNLILSYDYREWVNLFNRGKFYPISPFHKEWTWVAPKSSSACIGVKQVKKRENSLPAVLMQVDQNLPLNQTVPQNTTFKEKARALDVQMKKQGLELNPGRYKIFSSQIIIFEKSEPMEITLKRIKKENVI